MYRVVVVTNPSGEVYEANGQVNNTKAADPPVAIAVLQNLSLLVMPGEWSIGVTFFIFVIFMLFRPTGLFAAAR